MQLFTKILSEIANSADPDQTALSGISFCQKLLCSKGYFRILTVPEE